MRPLSRAACDVLRGQSRIGDLVFPPTRGEGTMSGFRKLWDRIAKLGALPTDVTPHVLRHSFASPRRRPGLFRADYRHVDRTQGAFDHVQVCTCRANSVLLAAADAVADETLMLTHEMTPIGEAPHAGGGIRCRNHPLKQRHPITGRSITWSPHYQNRFPRSRCFIATGIWMTETWILESFSECLSSVWPLWLGTLHRDFPAHGKARKPR